MAPPARETLEFNDDRWLMKIGRLPDGNPVWTYLGRATSTKTSNVSWRLYVKVFDKTNPRAEIQPSRTFVQKGQGITNVVEEATVPLELTDNGSEWQAQAKATYLKHFVPLVKTEMMKNVRFRDVVECAAMFLGIVQDGIVTNERALKDWLKRNANKKRPFEAASGSAGPTGVANKKAKNDDNANFPSHPVSQGPLEQVGKDLTTSRDAVRAAGTSSKTDYKVRAHSYLISNTLTHLS